MKFKEEKGRVITRVGPFVIHEKTDPMLILLLTEAVNKAQAEIERQKVTLSNKRL